MLNIYLYKPQGSNVHIDNDLYFDTVTISKIKTKEMLPIVQDAIRTVDKCTLDETTMLTSGPFGEGASLTNLSTGCKTLLNVMLNENEIFFGSECGGNAKEELFNWGYGNIYILNGVHNVTLVPDVTYNCHITECDVRQGIIDDVEEWSEEYAT